jgi:hypothetical protein
MSLYVEISANNASYRHLKRSGSRHISKLASSREVSREGYAYRELGQSERFPELVRWMTETL